MRKFIKRFLRIIFNAKSENGAVRALRDAYRKARKSAERRGEPAPLPPMEINAANMRPIIQQLRQQHAPIQHHFFNDCGNMLMYKDSQMAEEVLLHFAHKGIPCLPVHDSFIVETQYANECRDVMRKAFSWRFGQEIPVDVIYIVERTKRILDGPKALQASKEWNDLASHITAEIKMGDPSDFQ